MIFLKNIVGLDLTAENAEDAEPINFLDYGFEITDSSRINSIDLCGNLLRQVTSL